MTHNAEPDMPVITNIGNSHIENLGSRENICKAKLEITEGVPENGWVILNADEPMLFAQKGKLTQNLLFVSLQNPLADYRALNIREYEDSTEFDLVAGKRVVTNVRIPTIGRHNVYDATYAFAVGILLGMSDEEIKAGLMSFRNTGMRQNIYEYGGITIIEDCYNAGPESMKAAVEVLAKMADKTGCRTVAVLGDMRELGDYSKQLHMEVGTLVASRHISNLVTFGREAENIALGAINHAFKPDNISINTNIENPGITAKTVYELLRSGDAVLFKASRAVQMERVIGELKRLIDASDR
jgi:UDP-N-acetylmuramoyl-tripeptide--D-alanyl-D-alanine ligase